MFGTVRLSVFNTAATSKTSLCRSCTGQHNLLLKTIFDQLHLKIRQLSSPSISKGLLQRANIPFDAVQTTHCIVYLFTIIYFFAFSCHFSRKLVHKSRNEQNKLQKAENSCPSLTPSGQKCHVSPLNYFYFYREQLEIKVYIYTTSYVLICFYSVTLIAVYAAPLNVYWKTGALCHYSLIFKVQLYPNTLEVRQT